MILVKNAGYLLASIAFAVALLAFYRVGILLFLLLMIFVGIFIWFGREISRATKPHDPVPLHSELLAEKQKAQEEFKIQ